MELFIRPYQTSDLDNCRTLWAELTEWHRSLYADPMIGGDDPGSFFNRYLAEPDLYQVWVAEADYHVVGFMGLLINGDEAEIEPIIVNSKYRSQGIGQSLVRHVIEEAKKREIRFLSVRPVARNIKAINFFVNLDFNLVGRVELFQELLPLSDRVWKEDIQIHSHSLRY